MRRLSTLKTALTTALLLAPATVFAADSGSAASSSGTVIDPSINMSLHTTQLVSAIVGIGGAVVGVSAVIYGIRKIKSLIAG